MDAPLRLPDFLIVGAMKSGTTSLGRYLNTHDRLYLPNQECHFFDRQENYAQGLSWYAQRLMWERDGVRLEDAVRLGEKTPTYSFQPNCAARIHDAIPQVGLIWIFREPVARAYSNYLHFRKLGRELLDFRTAVAREQQRMKRNLFHGYIERSKYVVQVERFLEFFPREQMLFLLFEDLLRQPLLELNRVARFLGVAEFDDQHSLPGNSSRTVMPLSPLSLWIAQRATGYQSKPYRVIRRLNLLFPRKKPKLPGELAKSLREILAPYNERLASRTGLDLAAWHYPTD